MTYDEADAVRCILYEGVTGGSLIMALNSWVGGEDAPYWNRKGAYVQQLIPAALRLLAQGLIEVWESPLPPGAGEGSLMTTDRAREALTDPGNWWQYDPEDDSDPERESYQLGLTAGATYLVVSVYSIITTPAAQEQGITAWMGNG
jgi:hypothetical protein